MPEETKSETPQAQKKCVIYYKQAGCWPSLGLLGGQVRFDRLDACCGPFAEAFLNTGNEKNILWHKNTLLDERPGINFLFRHRKLGVFLFGKEVKFCPCCGLDIEVKKSREVTVKVKMKQVPDGYEEVESSKGGGQ